MNTHLHDFMSQHLSSAIDKEISVTYHDSYTTKVKQSFNGHT